MAFVPMTFALLYKHTCTCVFICDLYDSWVCLRFKKYGIRVKLCQMFKVNLFFETLKFADQVSVYTFLYKYRGQL